mgnify:CR=1
IAVRIDSLKDLFELGSSNSKSNISPEGANLIRTFAERVSLKELGLIQIEEILFCMMEENLIIFFLSLVSLILLISFF